MQAEATQTVAKPMPAQCCVDSNSALSNRKGVPRACFHPFFESSWDDSFPVRTRKANCAICNPATTVVALSHLGASYEMISHLSFQGSSARLFLSSGGRRTLGQCGHWGHAFPLEQPQAVLVIGPFALVAQLDRASVYGTECRKFESCRARHSFSRRFGGIRTIGIPCRTRF